MNKSTASQDEARSAGTDRYRTTGSNSTSVTGSRKVRRKNTIRSLTIAGISVAAAAGWFALARRQIMEDAKVAAQDSVTRAEGFLQQHREVLHTHLTTECQLLSEDPRLKSTLGTPGIDSGTILDILKDLHRLSGIELIAVLSPAGRVEAVIGAEQYAGLDLSTSAGVKQARSRDGVALVNWVDGERVFEVGIVALRLGPRVLGYLVLGGPLDRQVLDKVASLTGASVALAVENKVVNTSPADSLEQFRSLPLQNRSGASSFHTLAGANYATRVTTIPQTIPTVQFAAISQSRPSSAVATLLWAPLLVAVGFAVFSLWRSFASGPRR